MVLKMKNFNIFGGLLKIPTFRGGGALMKNQYRGGGLLKKWEGGLDNLPILGGLGKKKGGGVFEEGGVIPQCTL